ncbi:aldolase [Suhomyces tanzawaensis NRRL Y-17324]|uniref:Aldolase n=1 Tax=Suhomyces tanzawaensis NRRL Y-17324 TaxID=984487 RepID=A0A1E4SBE1_9ASCO|nr:aldolase [Suhomyces tanzawaensis NRRL Y-17324]ODV76722.1 aldolase [Suhomyces tanzawaensis NRRL Y-17324]
MIQAVPESPVAVVPDGIYTPIITYFLDDGLHTLDTKTQVKHATMLYQKGIQGLVVSGSMGEAANLTMGERLASLKAIRDAIPDRNFKIIAGVPPLSARDVIEESKLAAEVGADFLIVLVPGFFGPNLVSQDGLVDYFNEVADSSHLPIIIYNFPGTCNGVDINIDTFLALSENPNIVGVKLTHFNLATYTLLGQNKRFKENNFKPFTGLGQVLIPALSVGLCGAIDGLSGIFPKTMLQLYKLYKEGKNAEAAALQHAVTLVDEMISELNVVGVKRAVHEIHGFGELLSGRPPLSKVADAKAYSKHEANIRALHKIEKSL